ncbi:MAG: hydrogenase nickel incorporation protein HypB [Desulfobulbaceae bacterium]|jgi:hydrogenase nickel incorporation protein HypB|nr:hydrogenase nickel incorporation protein HypB [Desulfobulbaceae bacterium]
MMEDANHRRTRKSVTVLTVEASLFSANDSQAAANRARFDACGILAINLISSPGSGKTALLEATIKALADILRIGVIEGDIETARDAERIRAQGAPVVQLTTGGACHLDAVMVARGFEQLSAEAGDQPLDILFIENVGNLVCPASFDLGEHRRVVLVSVPEGPDKPAKYPAAFVGSQLFIISKTDLLPYFDFAPHEAAASAKCHNPAMEVFELSAKTGDGMAMWLTWLRREVAARRAEREIP